MSRWQQICLWVGSLIVLFFAVIVEIVPQDDALDRLLAIPAQGEHFTSRETPLNEQEKALLGEASAVKRLIFPDGQAPFLFSVIDGSRNRHAVHDPKYCFVGAGWQITDSQILETERGDLMQLQLERDGEQRQALFWFSDGQEWFVSPITFWFQATLRRLSFGTIGEEPLLYIVQTLGPQSDDGLVAVTLLEELEPWK